ncbi:MAG: 3'-5' exonuclease [Alkalispirochaeta sp.]
MADHSATPYRFITETAEFSRYRDSLRERGVELVAVDIEGEFNLHIYGEHFCLLQIFDGRDAVLVDPYTVDIAQIGAFFEDRDTLKITYDAAGDRSLLFRRHEIRMRGILDLRPAVELLLFEKKGLSSVLEDTLGLEPASGKKKFQQYNWTRRPIDQQAIEYALSDVTPLFRLKEVLFTELVNKGLLDAYIRENLKVQDTDPPTDREPGVLRSGQFRRLSPERQELFRRIFTVRDRYAQEANVPPNDMLSNKALYAVVRSEMPLERARPGRRVSPDQFAAMSNEIRKILSRN